MTGTALLFALLWSVSSQPPVAWSGTVVRAADAMPVPGALITVLPERGDSVLATGVTGARGTFRVQLSRSAERRHVRVRVLRIGQRPFLSPLLVVGDGAELAGGVQIRVPNDPVVLTRVVTRSDARCVSRDAGGAALVALLEEVRKSLLLSRLRSGDVRLTTRFRTYTELRSLQGGPTERIDEQFIEGESARPFQSVDLALLARDGYMVADGDASEYRAPDADVLLSEQFVEAHCFRVVNGAGADSAQVGIAFAPQGRRGARVEVEGTMWLDRLSSELLRVEFRYVGLSPLLQRTPQGGQVEFTRLANGVLFVSRWEIRMPRLTVVRRIDLHALRGRSTTEQPHVATLQVAGGDVVGMMRDGVVQFGAWSASGRYRRSGDTTVAASPRRGAMAGGATETLGAAFLAARPEARLGDLLTGRSSVTTQRTSTGLRYAVGEGGCVMHLLLDGVALVAVDGEVISIDALVPRSALRIVEVYRTAAEIPLVWRTELEPRAAPCGLVALWTMDG